VNLIVSGRLRAACELEEIMQQTTAVSPSVVVGVSSVAGSLWAAVGAILFGVTILYFVGFSNFPQAHTAAHDTRHASGFPCH
jgi:cobalt transporter subunit CbtB